MPKISLLRNFILFLNNSFTINLQDAPNRRAVHSSKAVGEPPLFLASVALFAVKDAIAAARLESGHHGWFVLDTPATPERIRLACGDVFTDTFTNSANMRPKLSI